MTYSTEFNKLLNAKIYFKPNDVVNKIEINLNYKIKELYLSYKNKLIFLLTYKLTEFASKKVIEYIDNNFNKSDDAIYSELKQLISRDDLVSGDRGDARIFGIKKYLDLDSLAPSKYLDIGCFKGDITNSIVSYFNIPKDCAYGVDIKNYDADNKNFTFMLYDKRNLPFDNGYFDLITVFMCLHHIEPKNLNILLSDISRVMKPGGTLIIREHGLNPLIKLNTHLLDVLHEYYDKVLEPSLDLKWTNNFGKEINNYNTIQYWVELLSKYGFTCNNAPDNLLSFELSDSNPFGNIIFSMTKA
jgi:SAM-dependent methyltransferase